MRSSFLLKNSDLRHLPRLLRLVSTTLLAARSLCRSDWPRTQRTICLCSASRVLGLRACATARLCFLFQELKQVISRTLPGCPQRPPRGHWVLSPG